MKTYNMFACVDTGDKSITDAIGIGFDYSNKRIYPENPEQAVNTEADARAWFDFDQYDKKEGSDCHGKSVIRLYDVPESIAEVLTDAGNYDISEENAIGCYAAYAIAKPFMDKTK